MLRWSEGKRGVATVAGARQTDGQLALTIRRSLYESIFQINLKSRAKIYHPIIPFSAST
jgi:hypothetical protein